MTKISVEISPPGVAIGPSYGDLTYLLDRANQSFADGRIAKTVIENTQRIAEIASGFDGFRGCFGGGYPYDALDQANNLVEVPTIQTFINRTKNEQAAPAAETARRLGNLIWPCVRCQETAIVPDDVDTLREFCEPCDLTKFQPRQLFKALPDSDIFLAYDSVGPDLEATVMNILTESGFEHSDNIGATLKSLRAYFEGDNANLPIDVHLMSTGDLLDACRAISSDPTSRPMVDNRAYYLRWCDEAFSLWENLLFTITAVGSVDPAVAQALREARSAIVHSYDDDALLTMSHRLPRLDQTLNGCPEVEKLLRARFASWRKSEWF